MGIFNVFGKKPAQGVQPLPAQEVIRQILQLNRESAPFQIVDGKSDGVDLLAEWKIVEARWHEIFAKAGIKKVFRIYMKLDPAKNEVRARDQEFTVEWRGGVPGLSLAASSFQGQQTSMEFGSAFAFTEKDGLGQVYNYHFNTNELKNPIKEAVKACGWKYKGIPFGKL